MMDHFFIIIPPITSVRMINIIGLPNSPTNIDKIKGLAFGWSVS